VRLVRTRVTASGKAGRVTTSNVPLVEDPDVTNTPPEMNAADPDHTVETTIEDTVPAIPLARKKTRKRGNDSVGRTKALPFANLINGTQTKMQSWLDVRSAVLDEIISLDGPGDVPADLCSSCLGHKETPMYRCLECSYGLLFCGECAVRSHQTLPLHRLEVCLFRSLTVIYHTYIIRSAGTMGFLTELLSIPSDTSAISVMGVPLVPLTHSLTIFSSSIQTVGTNYKSSSAAAREVVRALKCTVNCYECAGIRHHSTVLEPRSPLIFLKRTIK
jgi:hypothetical protein